MIKFDIDKGKGSFDVNGKWFDVLAEAGVVCLCILKIFSKNEKGFLEGKRQLLEMINSLTYADIEDDEKEVK